MMWYLERERQRPPFMCQRASQRACPRWELSESPVKRERQRPPCMSQRANAYRMLAPPLERGLLVPPLERGRLLA